MWLTGRNYHDILFLFIIRLYNFVLKETIFNTIQLITALLLTVAVLLQQKGASLGGVFGGSSNVYSTRRGVDKTLHYATIILAVIFFGTSLLRLVI